MAGPLRPRPCAGCAGQGTGAGHARQVGLEIQYFREVADEPVIPFAETLLHLDEHLLVADKPHFLPVTPAGGYVRETLLSRTVARTGNTDLVPLHRRTGSRRGWCCFRPSRRHAMPISACSASAALKRPTRRWHRRCLGWRSRCCGTAGWRQTSRSSAWLKCRASPMRAAGSNWSKPRGDLALPAAAGNRPQAPAAGAHGDAGCAHRGRRPVSAAQSAPGGRTSRLQLLAQGLAFNDPLSGERRRFRSQHRLVLPGQGD